MMMMMVLLTMMILSQMMGVVSGCTYDDGELRRGGETTASCEGFECLERYVRKDDGMFEWTDTGERMSGLGWKGYVLNVTSQKWLTPEDFDFTPWGGKPIGHVWWHIVVVIVPDHLRDTFDTGFLWITGGNNDDADPVPKSTDEEILAMSVVAVRTGIPCAYLGQVPNQHIVFAADQEKAHREEDATIAFTWSQFVDDASLTEWPLRLPMTKAAVKAMDAVTEFFASPPQDADFRAANLTKFGVAGASKRGWTTWTTGAVDNERVVMIVPIVMDELNAVANIHHHYRAYGGWSWALKDYYARNFTRCLDHPNTKKLFDIVDPFSYAERLTMPKLVVNSGMDEFFLPDDTSFWWDRMPEPKRFLMEPNTEHSQATGILELVPDIASYVNANLDGDDVPSFTWTVDRNGTGDIDVVVASPPEGVRLKEVAMWHATTCNSDRRDFRVIVQGWGENATECLPCGIKVKGLCTNLAVFWTKETLEESPAGSGQYKAHRDPPSNGRWTAFFVDVQYEPDTNATTTTAETARRRLEWPFLPKGDFEFTSEVSIVPNTFPYADCEKESCTGVLV